MSQFSIEEKDAKNIIIQGYCKSSGGYEDWCVSVGNIEDIAVFIEKNCKGSKIKITIEYED